MSYDSESAMAFSSEALSSGYFEFSENGSDLDQTDSRSMRISSCEGSLSSSDSSEDMTREMDANGYDGVYDSSGEIEDDVDKFIFDAIITALAMKDQMAISIHHFEDLLRWGKNLYVTNKTLTENNVPTLWPSKWDEACSLLENIGYNTPKQSWVCLDLSHPCLYGLRENKEDCCPHCGKIGSIPYYYLSLASKVKRWCSSSSMCTKMTSHWQQRDHWLPPERKTGWGFGLKKEFWDFAVSQNWRAFGIQMKSGFSL